jgi:hypothetical protein
VPSPYLCQVLQMPKLVAAGLSLEEAMKLKIETVKTSPSMATPTLGVRSYILLADLATIVLCAWFRIFPCSSHPIHLQR